MGKRNQTCSGLVSNRFGSRRPHPELFVWGGSNVSNQGQWREEQGDGFPDPTRQHVGHVRRDAKRV